MDEEIKPLLQEIATELRARNDLIREQEAKAEKMRSEMFSKMPFGERTSPERMYLQSCGADTTTR